MDAQWVGYAPDIDPTTPGVITECQDMIPSLRAMMGAPSNVIGVSGTVPGTVSGAISIKKLDGTARTIAGTDNDLYEEKESAWTIRTQSTAAHTLASTTRWVFAQFGDVTIAAAKEERIQSSASSIFGDISSTAPAARIVQVVGNFVLAFDCNDTSTLIDGADQPDRWWSSGLADQTAWTPSANTQAVSGRLVSSPGPIRAAKTFGNSVVVFKENSMFLGQYVGLPAVWDFQQIPGEIGCVSQEAVVDVGTPDNPRLVWMGTNDFYSYDGSRPVPIGINRIKNKVFSTIVRSRQARCMAVHDVVNGLVYFWYPLTDTGDPDGCVVWNYRNDRWGRSDRTARIAFSYLVPALTYANVGDNFSTYADIGDITYGSFYWTSTYPSPAIFNASNILYTLSGASTTSSITTGDYGDDVWVNTLSRGRVRYITAPSSAQMTNYYRMNLGESLTSDQTTTEVSSKFDVLRSARWHRLVFNFTGAVETTGLYLDVRRDGSE